MNIYNKFRKVISTALIISSLFFSSVNASGLLTAAGSELEIQDHQVSVIIEDGYAITTVENVFYNPSSQDLEAVYEFPVPENGTVAEFSIWIDGKAITGEVVEKEQARAIYEQEKTAGRDAGLTEKKSFYRFESMVSPVRAKQQAKTRLVYMQPADVEGGIGRYSYPLEEGGTDQNKVSFWQTDSKVRGQFSFDLKLRSGFPVDALRAPAHSHAVITSQDKNNWHLSLGQNGQRASVQSDATTQTSGEPRQQVFSDMEIEGSKAPVSTQQASSLDQDIVVYWRLQPNLPGSIELVTHKEPEQRQGTFMLTVTPGIDLQAIQEGRDWVFVLDRSGSMSGKYQSLMDTVSQALKTLRPDDRFRILLFSNSVEELTNGWTQASPQSINQMNQALMQSGVSGGTNLYAGLERAIRGLDADRTSGIVLVTDGVANVGKTEKKQFIKLMKKHDVRLFTAIMGNGANRPLLDSMTKVSDGFAASVSNSDDVEGIIKRAVEKVKYQALHDVTLEIKGLKTSDVIFSKSATVYRGQQMLVFGHYYGDDIAKVSINAKISGQDKQYSSQFAFPSVATNNPEVERLWAYEKIQEIKNQADYLQENLADYRSAIVDLSVKYGLVTDFTSMLVISDEQFAANGIERTNRDRRNKELEAQKMRSSLPTKSRRVDQAQPAFKHKQAHYATPNSNASSDKNRGGGSGAFGLGNLLLLLPIVLVYLRQLSYRFK